MVYIVIYPYRFLPQIKMDNMFPYGLEQSQNFHLINLLNLNFIIY